MADAYFPQDPYYGIGLNQKQATGQAAINPDDITAAIRGNVAAQVANQSNAANIANLNAQTAYTQQQTSASQALTPTQVASNTANTAYTTAQTAAIPQQLALSQQQENLNKDTLEEEGKAASQAQTTSLISSGISAPMSIYAGGKILGLWGGSPSTIAANAAANAPAVSTAPLAPQALSTGAGIEAPAGFQFGAGGAIEAIPTVATGPIAGDVGAVSLGLGADTTGGIASGLGGGIGGGSGIAGLGGEAGLDVGAADAGTAVLAADSADIGAGVAAGAAEGIADVGVASDAAGSIFADLAAVIAISVICTELNHQGYLNDEILALDTQYGKEHFDHEVYWGYRLLADPLIPLMQRSWLATQIVRPFGVCWAYEMAHRVKPEIKGNLLGKLLFKFGVPLCRKAYKKAMGGKTCQV